MIFMGVSPDLWWVNRQVPVPVDVWYPVMYPPELLYALVQGYPGVSDPVTLAGWW